MPLYNVEVHGNAGLCRAVNTEDAESYMEKRLGLDDAPYMTISLTTKDDEDWFEGMGGGYIYETPAHRKKVGAK